MLSNVASYFLYVFFRSNSILSYHRFQTFAYSSLAARRDTHTFMFIATTGEPEATNMTRDLITLRGGNNDGRIIKLNINNIIKVSATSNAINKKKYMVRLKSLRQVTGLPRCVDRLSDGFLEYAMSIRFRTWRIFEYDLFSIHQIH